MSGHLTASSFVRLPLLHLQKCKMQMLVHAQRHINVVHVPMTSYNPYTPGRSPCTCPYHSQTYPNIYTTPSQPPRTDCVFLSVHKARRSTKPFDVLYELARGSTLGASRGYRWHACLCTWKGEIWLTLNLSWYGLGSTLSRGLGSRLSDDMSWLKEASYGGHKRSSDVLRVILIHGLGELVLHHDSQIEQEFIAVRADIVAYGCLIS